ncbi:NAD(P)-dependent oxidoreductase [Bosea sp. (in: a-proteobacteria)]|uniref:NAD(P)-dependent oxidoreductase n=1 Tax=Bosea sp. (in: a-proteobacteria) TaxID=1871050 RepID=UPI00260386D7|nr:NAD(P)-dependent oxidoreductase [Bosea sp. (in: a-proteobacteria)]MCO5089559.1 NAD(P)-dependent oxidoreductase [Bosea sp. (in: a-proteobacteria)]
MPTSEHQPAPVRPRVGFIGLGKMGEPMVRCLARAGFPLHLFDIDADVTRRLAGDVAAVAAPSAEALAGQVDLTILMLPNSAIVKRVCLGAGDGEGGLKAGLRPGSLVVDMSSSDPMETRALGAVLRESGVSLLDAPVSGGVRKAVDGTLAIMLGGDDDAACAAALPVLGAMGKVFRTGSLASGHATKALNNFISAAGLAAACEAVIVAQSFGLDPAVMIDIVNASTGRNNSTEVKIKPFVLTGEFSKANFAMDLMAKDVETAARLAESLGLAMPNLAQAKLLWKAASAHLGRGADHTEIFRYLREADGSPPEIQGETD